MQTQIQVVKVYKPFRIRKEVLYGYLFILPATLLLAFFVFYPLSNSFLYSFQQTRLVEPETKWIGLANYIKLIYDPRFYTALSSTGYFAAGTVIIGTILALITALLLNIRLKFIGIYRTLFYMPVVTSMVAISMVWQWLYDTNYGVFNYLLSFLGIDRIQWLTDVNFAMPAMIIMTVWKSLGYRATIFLAGLQGIPVELYESAKVDGANAWRKFWSITLPMLAPTTFFIIVTAIIGSFQVFTQIYVMTQGGPMDSTNVLVFYMYKVAFRFFEIGYASAIAFVLALIVFILTLIQWKYRGVDLS